MSAGSDKPVNPPARARQAGFTLLETILAVTITALILAALHSALWSGVRAYRRCRDSSERDTMAWSGIRLIAEDLQRLTLQSPGNLQGASLLGLPEVRPGGGCLLRLRTHARAAPGAREMLVDYFFIPASRTSGRRGPPGRAAGPFEARAGCLARRSEPLLRPGVRERARPVGSPADVEARYEVVATGLRAVRLRYFDGQQWEDRWDSAQRSAAPKMVEVTVEFADEEGRAVSYVQALPVVVEGPLITAPAGEEAP